MFNGDSQLQPTRLPCKSCDKLLHQTSPAFLAAQKIREAFGERLCATCHDDNLALQGYDIPVQWTVVEGNLRNPHFYTSSFHALCSERKKLEVRSVDVHFHPTDKLKACCSKVTLEGYLKTPLSSWVQKVDLKNIIQHMPYAQAWCKQNNMMFRFEIRSPKFQ